MSDDLDTRILEWIGRLGAAGAADVAARFAIAPAVANRRLAAAVRRRSLRRVALLAGEPALYVATRAGLAAVRLDALAPTRVSAAGFAHLQACARVAVALQQRHPRALVAGERELRLAERRAGTAVASVELGAARRARPVLDRPDLVLFGERGPIAIEVELTTKAPARLREIVRAWARCRLVQCVVYVSPPATARAVARAIDAMRAHDRVALVQLGELLAGEAGGGGGGDAVGGG